MSFSTTLALVIGTLLPFIFIPLILGNPARTDKKIMYFGILGGIAAGIGILFFKLFFFKEGMSLPTKETLTITLFISLIEAGLLEECFKNGAFLICLFFLSKQIDFKENKFSYLALGAFVGMGFGILENAYYAIGMKYQVGIISDRVFTTIPAHMMMNMIFGFLISQRVNPLLALTASIIFHGLYDFFALPSTLLGGILVRAMLICGLGLCFWMGKYLLGAKDKPENSNSEVKI